MWIGGHWYVPQPHTTPGELAWFVACSCISVRQQNFVCRNNSSAPPFRAIVDLSAIQNSCHERINFLRKIRKILQELNLIVPTNGVYVNVISFLTFWARLCNYRCVSRLHAHIQLEKRDSTTDSTFENYDVNNIYIYITYTFMYV